LAKLAFSNCDAAAPSPRYGPHGGKNVDDSAIDGIVEDLTALLAQAPDFVVVARNAAFEYRDRPIDIRRVGSELGVRYALEGSVRQINAMLRVNVQLISTDTGAHVWSDQFEAVREEGNIGIDELVRKIAVGAVRSLVDSEAARGSRERPENPDAFDLMLQARSLQFKPATPDQNARMTALYERAVTLDPSSATALSGLALAIMDRLSYFRPEDPLAPEILHRAETLVTQAEALRPSDVKVMAARDFLLLREWRCDELILATQ
jgi:adenylate cyclase